MSFGDKVKVLLKKDPRKQSEFCEDIGESFSTFNKVLNGRDPSFQLLLKIAAEFPDVDLNWLIKDDFASKDIIYIEQSLDESNVISAEKLIDEMATRLNVLKRVCHNLDTK